MALEQYAANNLSTTLTAAIDNIQTSLIVTSAAGFPSSASATNPFRIAVDSEGMTVTNVSGTTFTIVRGAMGTTAASHLISATVYPYFSKEAAFGLASNFIQRGLTASRPAAGNQGYRYISTDDYYEWYDDGTAWQVVNDFIDAYPANGFKIRDEFMKGTTSTGGVGELGWVFTGGSVTLQASDTAHPGYIRRDTGSTINTVAYMYLRSTSTNATFDPSSTRLFDSTFIIRLPGGNNANTTCRIGFQADASGNPSTDGIYIDKTAAATVWTPTCRAASTSSVGGTTPAVTANWLNIRMRRTSTGVIFNFDGGADIAVTTNVPAVSLHPVFFITNLTAASQTLDADYCSIRYWGLSR